MSAQPVDRLLFKRLLIGLVALAVMLVGTPNAALAGPHDNNNASVGGVTGTGANDAGCLAGYFCLYTQSFGNGVKFSLRQCRVYALSHWNGVGSFTNNNTHGAPAQLLDRNYNVIYTSYPFEYVPRFDFAPVWYVRACLW